MPPCFTSLLLFPNLRSFLAGLSEIFSSDLFLLFISLESTDKDRGLENNKPVIYSSGSFFTFFSLIFYFFLTCTLFIRFFFASFSHIFFPAAPPTTEFLLLCNLHSFPQVPSFHQQGQV